MVNLTPHDITIRRPDGSDWVIPADGTVARVEMAEKSIEARGLGIPVIRRNAGPVVGLPRDERGVPMPCIVSSMVLAALPAGTLNVYAPDTGATAIRNEKGQVIAVTRLVAS